MIIAQMKTGDLENHAFKQEGRKGKGRRWKRIIIIIMEKNLIIQIVISFLFKCRSYFSVARLIFHSCYECAKHEKVNMNGRV